MRNIHFSDSEIWPWGGGGQPSELSARSVRKPGWITDSLVSATPALVDLPIRTLSSGFIFDARFLIPVQMSWEVPAHLTFNIPILRGSSKYSNLDFSLNSIKKTSQTMLNCLWMANRTAAEFHGYVFLLHNRRLKLIPALRCTVWKAAAHCRSWHCFQAGQKWNTPVRFIMCCSIMNVWKVERAAVIFPGNRGRTGCAPTVSRSGCCFLAVERKVLVFFPHNVCITNQWEKKPTALPLLIDLAAHVIYSWNIR